MNLQVRKAFESDKQAISDVVITAFGDVQGQEIVDLITDLLEDPSAQPLLSLVVTVDDNVVGHILFTSAQIKHSQRMVSSAILAPLSVHPEHQNQGIGGRLIKEGLKQLKTAGVELVFVLGHPGYYPKYGFSTAGIKGFEASYPIPPENSGAWMVQELHPGVIGHVSGKVICADALNDPKHWRE
jgi:putative acetyltransferase